MKQSPRRILSGVSKSFLLFMVNSSALNLSMKFISSVSNLSPFSLVYIEALLLTNLCAVSQTGFNQIA